MSSTAMRRLGLPRVAGSGLLLAAWLVDTAGSGMFLPFVVAFLAKASLLPLTVIGGALSVGAALAIPTPAAAGWLVDRFGARRVFIAGNLLEAAAFAGILSVHAAWQVVCFALAVNAGRGLFWVADNSLIAASFDGPERTRWYGVQNAIRCAGAGAGGVLAIPALTGHGADGYRLLAVANAASFLIAAFLVAVWRQPDSAAPAPAADRGEPAADKPREPGGKPAGGYRHVLGDTVLLRLVTANVAFVLCELILEVVLALYLIRDLGLPVWWAGVLFSFAMGLVIIGQTTIVALIERRSRAVLLRAGAFLWAAAFLGLWAASAIPAPLVVTALFLAMALHTLAGLITDPIMRTAVSTIGRADLRGRYLAVYQLSWTVGEVIAPVAFAWLFTEGPTLPWIVLALACVACASLIPARGSLAGRSESL
jgi:MFS family permease